MFSPSPPIGLENSFRISNQIVQSLNFKRIQIFELSWTEEDELLGQAPWQCQRVLGINEMMAQKRSKVILKISEVHTEALKFIT